MLVFREVLEAALVITLVLGVTRGVVGRKRWIGGGLALGLGIAVLVAIFADAIGSAMDGVGQEVFNASVLFTAVVLLGWHNIWMKQHAQELIGQVKSWGKAVSQGEKPLYGLAIVVALAVSREGSELVLFLNGVVMSGTETGSMVTGGLIGLFGGIALGAVIYFGLVQIPTKHIFTVASWLILLLAAGMASQAAGFLVQADILPSLGSNLWNSSHILSERSTMGQILHVLIGYDERPSGIQLLFYTGTLSIIGALMWLSNRDKSQTSASAASVPAAITLLAGSMLLMPHSADAGTKIYSPIVEKGEWELAVRSQMGIDDDPDLHGATKIKPELGYGVTSYWYTEILGEFEGQGTSSSEFEAVVWENIFQLTEQGQYWVDLGLYTEYEASDEFEPKKTEFKLLLQKSSGKIVHTANLISEQKFLDSGDVELEYGYAWRTLYKMNRFFEPALEYFVEVGEAEHFGTLSDQDHRLGPMFQGEYGLGSRSKIAYEFGYLFGLNNKAPAGTIKSMVEYEFRF